MNANFESYARQQLSGHEVEVDTDALWADVYPHVKPEEKNRKFLWFFTLGLLVGLTGFGVYFYNQDTKTNQNISDATVNSTTTVVDNNSTDKNTNTAALAIATENPEKEITPAINKEANINNKSNTTSVTNSTTKTTKEASNKSSQSAGNTKKATSVTTSKAVANGNSNPPRCIRK